MDITDRLVELHAACAAVAPVSGVSVAGDGVTCEIQFDASATDDQRAAALAIAAAFDVNAPAVPASIKMWQAKAVLEMTGKLAAADAAIEASGNAVLIIAWKHASDLSRKSQALPLIAELIGLTNAEIDELFIAGKAIAV